MSEQDDKHLKTTTLVVSAGVSLKTGWAPKPTREYGEQSFERENGYTYSPTDKRRGVFLS